MQNNKNEQILWVEEQKQRLEVGEKLHRDVFLENAILAQIAYILSFAYNKTWNFLLLSIPAWGFFGFFFFCLS